MGLKQQTKKAGVIAYIRITFIKNNEKIGQAELGM